MPGAKAIRGLLCSLFFVQHLPLPFQGECGAASEFFRRPSYLVECACQCSQECPSGNFCKVSNGTGEFRFQAFHMYHLIQLSQPYGIIVFYYPNSRDKEAEAEWRFNKLLKIIVTYLL